MRSRLLNRTIYVESIKCSDAMRDDVVPEALPSQFFPLRAHLFDQKAELTVHAYEAKSSLTLRFHVRSVCGIKLGDGIIFEGKSYEVVGIRVVALRTAVELVVQSISDEHRGIRISNQQSDRAA